VAGAGVAAVETNAGANESVTLRAARLDAIRIYTANDTWTKPANLDFVLAWSLVPAVVAVATRPALRRVFFLRDCRLATSGDA
jgi:hypothetical protein